MVAFPTAGSDHPSLRRISVSARAISLTLAVLLSVFLSVPCIRSATRKAAADGWPEITTEEKRLRTLTQDPEADAVVLSMEREGKIVRPSDRWLNVLQYHVRIKILKESGTWLGEVHIPAGKYSRVSNITARTIKADGTIMPVDESQILKTVVTKARGFVQTDWVFNFPAVEPGAIIEYRYDRHDNSIYYVDPWYFKGPVFTLRSKVTQAFPGTMAYSILCDRCPTEIKPQLSKWREGKLKGTQYTMELRDLSGYRSGLLMPPPRIVNPRIEMVLHTWKGVYEPALGRQDAFFTDWPSVATVASHYYSEAMKKDRAGLRSLVQTWTQSAGDPDEKAKAILRHVREDFKYISYNSVLGGSRPLEKILKDKTADNEEKAVLLHAALQEAGIASEIALVVGKHVGSLNPNFTSLSQFSHAIVGLPKPDGEYTWLDPTVTCAPFDFMPWQDSGAGALLLKEKDPVMIDLPVKLQLSTARYDVTVTPRPDGRASLEIVAEFRGEDALDYRDTLQPSSEDGRKKYLQSWLDEHRDGAVLKSHTIEKLDDFEEPLVIKMTAEAPGLVTLADGVLAVRACVLTCFDSNPIPRGERTHPIFVDRGWNEAETITIVPPEGMAPAPRTMPLSARTAVATLTSNCASRDDGSMRCTRQFIARRNRWQASVYVEVREMFDKIVAADQTRVAFQAR